MAVDSLGIDRYGDALSAKCFGSLTDKFPAIDCTGIDGDFIGSGLEEVPNVFDLVDSSAHRKRHENLIGGARYDIQNNLAVLMGSRDVEETEFVCSFAIVHAGNFNRVTCIPKLKKFYTLDDPSGLNVKTRYYSFGEHGHSDD